MRAIAVIATVLLFPAVGMAAEERATFALGCFWSGESAFEHVDGVLDVTSGYSGGTTPTPTYEAVETGSTGHAESVQVTYDPARVSYDQLLNVFWHNVDPVSANAQFCDHGPQYRSAIFYGSEAEKQAALRTRDEVASRLGENVVTEIDPAGTFWPAEAYHQDYAEKNKLQYGAYRIACGRERRLAELRKKLDGDVR